MFDWLIIFYKHLNYEFCVKTVDFNKALIKKFFLTTFEIF